MWTAVMAQQLALVLDVPETPGDQDSLELSPYEESEVHDSFHQLIQEQSRWVAEEGLELQQVAGDLGAPASGHQTLLEPEGGPVYSTATLSILASMPSRTIGRSRGAIISKYYNHTVRLRRRHSGSRPILGPVVCSARPSLRLYDLELDPADLEEEEKWSLLVKELQGLPVAQRDHMLRGMPLSLQEKRVLREKSRTPRGKQRGRQGHGGVFCCSQLRYTCVLALHSLGLVLLTCLHALRPWRYALKQIGGQFGSSVLSYFLFLKTLLAFNMLLLLPLVAFLVAVQAAFTPEAHPAPTCTGLELLTGGGCFTHTVMYYGYYSNTTLNTPCGPLQCGPRAGSLPYSMPLAYLFTVGAAFFITCITLVYSMSHSFGESYRVGSTKGIHAITVFCSWDYKVTQNWASRLQRDNICTQLKSPVVADQEAGLLVLPLVICLLNLGAPYLFRGLATLERHDSPVLEVYVAIGRLISERRLRGKPEFDIARNVLDLIYGQTLTWLGVLFSPLLPAVQILRLLILFQVKKASLMANCQAPRRPWLASHMSTVFLTLLCFPSFLGAAVFLCYAVWQVKPSDTCGPFRSLDTMYEAGTVWVRHLEQVGPGGSWLSWLHRYLVENTFFLFLASALLLAVIYLNIQVVKGQRKVICLLKEQIRNEGEDKIFLINRLHSVYERKERRSLQWVRYSCPAASVPSQQSPAASSWPCLSAFMAPSLPEVKAGGRRQLNSVRGLA
ncbi:transmembrane channel-like protein 6 isoform X10 [Heterocephalus glaber]|uniref:Transmembrane channel-like protein n=1 Tax=Heterocephalus glaber TaxID=10181 RepID=A0AAX6RLZ1_HETGA|nr:transmembrane channel-like protein 6 isoform X10 [Heterocephalus glaber]